MGPHDMVALAIREGRLTRQPCEECGNERALAHHDDYAKPLDVRWLCHSHHRKWHGRNAAKNKGAIDGTVVINVRLPSEMHETLTRFADSDARPVSSAVRLAIRDYLAARATA